MDFDQLIQLPYEQVLEEIYQNYISPDLTWPAKRDYLEQSYSQNQIIEIYLKIGLQLSSIKEDKKYDAMLDELDPIWLCSN